MSAEFATTDRVLQIGTAAAVAAGSTSVFRVGKPANVKRIVLVMTAAQTTAGATATVSISNRDGTSSVTVGTFVIPVAAINAVLKADIGGVKTAPIVNTGEVSQNQTIPLGVVNGYQTNLPGQALVNVGQQLSVVIAAGGAAGTADIHVEYQEQGNNQTRFAPTDMAVTFS